MGGLDLAAHVTLIAVHAAAAAAAFVLAVLLIRALPAARTDRRLRAFTVLIVVAMVALGAVVVLDWGRLPVGKRVAFAVLCGLAIFLLVRIELAWRATVRRPAGWHRAFIGHVGFVLISLFDGFCIVSAIDLRLPPVAIVVAAVLGVVLGVVVLRRAVRRDAGRGASLTT